MQLPEYASRARERIAPYRTQILQGVLAAIGIFIAFAAYHLLLPAQDFPSNHLIVIPEDASVGEMGHILADRGAIRSQLVFKVYARLTFKDRSLESGPYVFEKPLGVLALVDRMAEGKHGIIQVRVTLTEGMTAADMARTLERSMPDFDTESFLELASTSEGYLFPDTYFFIPGTTPQEAYDRLRSHFDELIKTVENDILASGRSLEDIVIMASLLEREAQSEEDMRIVSGILWKRLDTGMRLQVDAVFGYIRGENGYEPTADDLKFDSPYNTYLYEGLPPTPISNPGLTALRAAAVPLSSSYLYYLTGRDGLMYYGRTFAEHTQNRALHLD